MKPLLTLARARTPGGAELTLHAKDTHFFLRVNREPLMATNAPESEKEMARLACEPLRDRPGVRILIGGLGFGFTLHRCLELLGPDAALQVAELLPEVVAWNREFLGHLNGHLLDDPRVHITIADVFTLIAKARPAAYDAILLDVDNGPSPMVQKDNARLYNSRGLAAIQRALKPGGRATFWSASPDRAFAERLTKAGFTVGVVPAKAYEQAKRHAHTIFVADAP
jgi:spermidine synthase